MKLNQAFYQIMGVLVMASALSCYLLYPNFSIDFAIGRFSLGLIIFLASFFAKGIKNGPWLGAFSIVAFSFLLNVEASFINPYQAIIIGQIILFNFLILGLRPLGGRPYQLALLGWILAQILPWVFADVYMFESYVQGALAPQLAATLAFTVVNRIINQVRSAQCLLIGKREKAEQDLVSANEELDKLKNDLKSSGNRDNRVLRVAVHDINNRIASLKNLSKLFDMKFSKMHEESLTKYNQKLEEIASELEVFTGNLLSPVKSKEFPEIKVQPNFVELKPLVDNLVEDLRFKASHKNVGLNLIQTNKDLHLYVDKTYLKVVLRNLINYAIKFSQNNNQVIISSSVRFGKVFIEVMDKSRGIEKETLERMFSFLPDNIEDKMEDTTKGIGLSVARYLTEKMGGRIDFESSVELGLHFSLVFDAVTLPPESLPKDENRQNYSLGKS